MLQPTFATRHACRTIFFCSGLLLMAASSLQAFSYVGDGKSVVHPAGYTGREKVLHLTVALHPDSAKWKDLFEFSARQAVNMWNQLLVSSPNLEPCVEIFAKGGTDGFGVLIHEMGHTLGLAHPSLGSGSKSPVRGEDRQYALSTPGPNGQLDLDPGPDGVSGSGDDQRGDDENLNYFKIADNDPFTLPESGIIDSTTYTLDLSHLPAGNTFSSSSNRETAKGAFGHDNAEGMMITGGSLRVGQVRRGLGADDVAGIRYAMSGLDEKQGTSDDYRIELEYVGVRSEASILIKVAPGTGFAAAGVVARPISPTHRVMVPNRAINYNSTLARGRQWVFPVPEPVEVKATPLNATAVSLTFPTEPGRRYAVTWPQEPGTTGILIQFKGELITPTTGGLHLWIADRTRTEIKFAFLNSLPDLAQLKVFALRGEALEP